MGRLEGPKRRRYGIGCGTDETAAAACFEKAALQEHANAQYLLANCFRRGVGAPKDDKHAFKWSLSAALQGHAQAHPPACTATGRTPNRRQMQRMCMHISMHTWFRLSSRWGWR